MEPSCLDMGPLFFCPHAQYSEPPRRQGLCSNLAPNVAFVSLHPVLSIGDHQKGTGYVAILRRFGLSALLSLCRGLRVPKKAGVVSHVA